MTRGIINRTAVRIWCKGQTVRIEGEAINQLERLAEEILLDARNSADINGRTTIMVRDFKDGKQ